MRFKKFSIIISLALVVVFLCSFVAPSVQASFLPGSGGSLPGGGGLVPYIASSLGDWIISQGFDWMLDQSMDIAGFLGGLIFDDICPYNTDSHRHDFKPQNVDGDASRQVFVCQYCGKYGDEVLRDAYGTPATDDTEATGFVGRVNDELGTTIVGKDCLILPLYTSSDEALVGTPGFNFVFSKTQLSSWDRFYLSCTGTAPVDGVYTFKSILSVTGCRLSDEGFIVGSTRSFSAGTNISGRFGFFIESGNTGVVSGQFWFEVTPLSAYNVNTYTASIGGASSRPSGFLSNIVNGFFGLLDDAGELVVSAAKSIFSESDNTYTNPATGTTSTVTDWTYDYSDRSYHLTTEEGDTVTVTYGDENITIEEGDQTYTVYYVVQNNISGGVCTDGNGHDWGAPTTVPATCTTAGSETQICSKCGEAKTTQLPPLGHKWIVKTTVQTKYDEKGQLLQQGYTIYECERCGEQYKSTDGTGPPVIDPGGSGGDDGGDSIWDAIVEFFKNIASSFASLPDWFSRFSAFLASAFSYLPDEIVLLLTFGVFSVVAIGIWKAVRR